MSRPPRRLLCVYLALVGVVISACENTTAVDRLDAPPLFSTVGDTVPCPENRWGWTVCTSATSDQLGTLVGQAQRIAPPIATGQCHAAGQAVLGALDGTVLIHHHSFPGAEISFDQSSGPPYSPAALVVGDYLTWSEHVGAGNTLNMLYHEGGHLLGIGVGNEPVAEAFAADCVARHREEEVVEEPSSGSSGGGGGGGECDEANPCDDAPTWCLVHYWYWMDTGQIIHFEVLYCY